MNFVSHENCFISSTLNHTHAIAVIVVLYFQFLQKNILLLINLYLYFKKFTSRATPILQNLRIVHIKYQQMAGYVSSFSQTQNKQRSDCQVFLEASRLYISLMRLWAITNVLLKPICPLLCLKHRNEFYLANSLVLSLKEMNVCRQIYVIPMRKAGVLVSQ